VKRGGGGREVLAFDVDRKPWTDQGGRDRRDHRSEAFTMAYYGLKMLDEVYHDPPKDLAKDYSADSFAPTVLCGYRTSIVDQSNVDLYIAGAAQENK